MVHYFGLLLVTSQCVPELPVLFAPNCAAGCTQRDTIISADGGVKWPNNRDIWNQAALPTSVTSGRKETLNSKGAFIVRIWRRVSHVAQVLHWFHSVAGAALVSVNFQDHAQRVCPFRTAQPLQPAANVSYVQMEQKPILRQNCRAHQLPPGTCSSCHLALARWGIKGHVFANVT